MNRSDRTQGQMETRAPRSIVILPAPAHARVKVDKLTPVWDGGVVWMGPFII